MKNKNITIIDEKSVYIEDTVKIGNNVTIYPSNFLFGNTIIEDNVTLMPNNQITNSTIKENSKINCSVIENSIVGENVSIGPYAHLRPNSGIGNNCKIGNFVEIKNSNIGDGTKVSHLAYVGDADIGKNCNVGCGAIFVNYNGKEKNRTIVKDNCFIGSNVNVVAPVVVAEGTYICAGTTLTQNTNEYDFVIGRVRETIKSERAMLYLKNDK